MELADIAMMEGSANCHNRRPTGFSARARVRSSVNCAPASSFGVEIVEFDMVDE
jgi:hypothetical protein